MNMFCTVALFLIFGRSLADQEEEKFVKEVYKNDPFDIHKPVDFRCSQVAFSNFNFSKFRTLYYVIKSEENGCRGIKMFYPPLTALDPMMPFYINKVYEGIGLVAKSPRIPLSIPYTPERRKKYCTDIRMVASALADYMEIFQNDDETCWKIEEIAKECYTFRQMWFYWVRNLYERLCLGEDGCYKTMELYEDEMPHCVKYIVKRQFQNVTYGSWHHSMINYCQLTDMVPEAKDTNYDRSILFEEGRTEDDLLAMCQFLRYFVGVSSQCTLLWDLHMRLVMRLPGICEFPIPKIHVKGVNFAFCRSATAHRLEHCVRPWLMLWKPILQSNNV